MPTVDRVRDLHTELVDRCPPLTFPDPWAWVPGGADCRGPLPDPAGFLAEIEAGYRPDVIDAAHVTDAGGPGGTSRVRPTLARPGGGLIAIRDGGQLRDVLTVRGCLRWP